MEASLGWIVITGYAMVQNLAFFFLFLTQRSALRPIKWILAFISLCAALLLFDHFFRLTYGYEKFPHLIFALSPLWYLIGPLLFFYLRVQIKGNGFSRIDLLHLIPALLIFYNSLDFYSFPASAKLHYIKQFGQGGHTAVVHNINYLIFLVQVVGYSVAGLQLFRSASRPNPNQRWHKTLLFGLILFAVLGLLLVLSANVGSWQLIRLNSQLFILWLTGYILFIFIQSIRHPNQLYFKIKKINPSNGEHHFIKTSHEVSTYFINERPYLDPDYNIHQLAIALGHSKNHLQQAIKHCADKSFRDYLNTFRIAAAKKNLPCPKAAIIPFSI